MLLSFLFALLSFFLSPLAFANKVVVSLPTFQFSSLLVIAVDPSSFKGEGNLLQVIVHHVLFCYNQLERSVGIGGKVG